MYMKKNFFSLTLFISLLLSACNVVPITGRSQISLVSESQILAMSQSQYRSFIQKAPLSKNRHDVERVHRVGTRIARATVAYLNQNGMDSRAKELAWEFNLVESKQLNAFCMPGGKIVVYTGLLRLLNSDDELAAVVSHEVAHAVARHSNERISNEMLRRMGGQVLGVAVAGESAALQQVIGQAYGIGSQVFISLPYSRKHEYEADRIGLVFMAMAGYDPEGAVSLWKKMAQGSRNKNDMLSTHPTDEKRIAAIRKYMPEAKRYYKGRGVFNIQPLNQQNTDRSGNSKPDKPRTSEDWRF